MVIADFVFPSPNAFYDLEPTALYRLWIPFVGWKDISARENSGDRILVYYFVNYTDGSGTAYVYNASKEKMILTEKCQIGIAIALTKTNSQQIRDSYTAIMANAMLAGITGSLNSAVSALSGKADKAIGAVESGISAGLNAQLKTMQLYGQARTTANGSSSSLYQPLVPLLRKIYQTPIENLDDHAKLTGRPLLDFRTLTSLSGYTRVLKIHLEDVPALDIEKAEIERLLGEGVIL